MVKKKTKQVSWKDVTMVIMALAVIVLGGWRVWDATSSNSNSGSKTKTGQKSVNTVLADHSVVENPEKGTNDLITFLKSDGERCRADNINHFKIIQELPGRFAKMRFGCGGTDAYIFAQFKDGKWKLISPTDQFMPDGTPSCEMVYSHGISNKIAPKCAALGQSKYRDNPFN